MALLPRKFCVFALFFVLIVALHYVGGLQRGESFVAVDAIGQSHIVHQELNAARTEISEENTHGAERAAARVEFSPTYTIEKLASGAEVEYIWQNGARDGSRPRAVLLLAHGCSHGAVDFWPRDRERCPRCKGLPEEIRIVRAALVRDFFVVALSSADRKGSRCWDLADSPYGDFARARDVMRGLYITHALHGLPLFVLGASSGGAFALSLPYAWDHDTAALPIAGLVCQIMAAPPAFFRRPLMGGKPYPPVQFEHMPRDERTARLITHAVDTLQHLGVRHRVVEVLPRPIGSSYFSRYIDGVSDAQSNTLRDALVAAGLLAESDSLLTQDPRGGRWRIALRAHEPATHVVYALGDSLEPDESAISEELNVAWAMHEITSQNIDSTLDWLEAQWHSSNNSVA